MLSIDAQTTLSLMLLFILPRLACRSTGSDRSQTVTAICRNGQVARIGLRPSGTRIGAAWCDSGRPKNPGRCGGPPLPYPATFSVLTGKCVNLSGKVSSANLWPERGKCTSCTPCAPVGLLDHQPEPLIRVVSHSGLNEEVIIRVGLRRRALEPGLVPHRPVEQLHSRATGPFAGLDDCSRDGLGRVARVGVDLVPARSAGPRWERPRRRGLPHRQWRTVGGELA